MDPGAPDSAGLPTTRIISVPFTTWARAIDYQLHEGYEYVFAVVDPFGVSRFFEDGVYRRQLGDSAWSLTNSGLGFDALGLGELVGYGEKLYLRTADQVFFHQSAPLYSLIVDTGYVTGFYRAGDTIDIFSRELSRAEILEEWIAYSDPDHLDLLERTDEWHTRLVMPVADVVLKAVIDTVDKPVIRYDTLTFETYRAPVIAALPEKPVGLILLLHDSGKSGAEWFTGTDGHQFVRDALDQRFGLLAVDARDYPDENMPHDFWQVRPATRQNPRVQWMIDVVEGFVGQHPSLQNLPLFALGVGNGGDMAAVAGPLLDVRGIAQYSAGGGGGLAAGALVPTIFLLTHNGADDNAVRDSVVRHAALLEALSIANKVVEHLPTPVYPERFARIEGIDRTLSTAIANELRQNGDLSPSGYLSRTPAEILSSALTNPSLYTAVTSLPEKTLVDLRHELDVVRAAPVFFSDRNRTVLDFFRGVLSTDVESEEEIRVAPLEDMKLTLAPNPVDGRATIYFSLLENRDYDPQQEVSLTLHDILGRQISTLYSAKGSLGEHWIAEDFSSLPYGIYLMRLRRGDDVRTVKVVVW